MTTNAEIALVSYVQCSKCRIVLALVNRQTSNLIQDPAFTYYHRWCNCNPDDTSIIRIPLQHIEHEVVEVD